MATKTPQHETAEGRRKQADKGNALPDGSFPIPNVAYLRKAIQAFGRADPAKKARVKAHIIRRAKALGREDLIPDSWKQKGGGKNLTEIQLATTHSSRVHRGLDRSPKENWVDKAGGLPNYIERIAKHLHSDQGMTISRAIAVAVNVVKKMCATGDLNYPGKQSVNPGSRAQACNAVRQWEQKKARARKDTTEVRGRKLTDAEYIALAAQRAPGASGSNRPFDESKYLRNPANGKFAQKFTPTELIAARRTVEGGITNLQIGQTFKLPGDVGWVQRTAGGYLIQGPAGIRVAVRELSEAVAAAANLIAGKLRRVGEPVK